MDSSGYLAGPAGRPFVGHALSLYRDGLEFLLACSAEYGDLIPLRFFWKPVLFVNHPYLVRTVLTTGHRKVVKGIAHRTDRALMGDGVSLSEGDDWLRERRMIQPAFHRDRLDDYAAIVVAITQRLIETWRDGDRRDVGAEMQRLAAAIVAQALLDVDLLDEHSDLAEALSAVLALRTARARSLELLLPERLPTPGGLLRRRARHRLDDAIWRAIRERQRRPGRGDDLLSTLLSQQVDDDTKTTAEHARNEVVTLLVGGTETVANLLSWSLHLLSRQPEVEAQLVAEIDRALAGRPAEARDLSELPYTAAVVAETLRLYPPAPVLSREAIAELELGGYRVGIGTELVMSPWVMHRDPRYFADPEAFRPERWLDGLAGRLPGCAYFPFGAGPRVCMGRSFATREAILVLATLLQRFRFGSRPGQRVVAEAVPTLHPKHGLPMVIRARERGPCLVDRDVRLVWR